MLYFNDQMIVSMRLIILKLNLGNKLLKRYQILKTLRLACDVSDVSLGVVLGQVDELGREQPVASAN